MDLRQLEILQAIAETGSFTACGRKLHVSQSAISRQIMLLEEELGEPLFLRVGRKVRMTPAAESLVQLGKRMQHLPEEQRTAIILKEYHGLTFQEIADLQGCPLSTVKTRLYQGLSVLRRQLEASGMTRSTGQSTSEKAS